MSYSVQLADQYHRQTHLNVLNTYVNLATHLTRLIPDLVINGEQLAEYEQRVQLTALTYNSGKSALSVHHLLTYHGVPLNLSLNTHGMVTLAFPIITTTEYKVSRRLLQNWQRAVEEGYRITDGVIHSRSPIKLSEMRALNQNQIISFDELVSSYRYEYLGRSVYIHQRPNFIAAVTSNPESEMLDLFSRAYKRYSKLVNDVANIETRTRNNIYNQYVKLKGTPLLTFWQELTDTQRREISANYARIGTT